MTENNLLATAAAAMVSRMIRRSNPLVFRPVSPSKNILAPGMSVAAAIIEERLNERQEAQWVVDKPLTFRKFMSLSIRSGQLHSFNSWHEPETWSAVRTVDDLTRRREY